MSGARGGGGVEATVFLVKDLWTPPILGKCPVYFLCPYIISPAHVRSTALPPAGIVPVYSHSRTLKSGIKDYAIYPWCIMFLFKFLFIISEIFSTFFHIPIFSES